MDKPLMNNPKEYPDNKVLSKYLGPTISVWDAFCAKLASDFTPMVVEWKYYNDGKAWLGKLIFKKKTVCWISVWNQYFKTTFYFTEKNDQGLENLNINQVWKKNYKNSQSAGKIKPLTIEVKNKKVLSDVFELIKYKANLL